MTTSVLFVAAFAAGLTLSGIALTLLELIAGRTVSLRAPAFPGSPLAVSLLTVLVAGPLMLFADALEARRDRHFGDVAFLSCTLVAGLWAVAAGILVIELAVRGPNMLSLVG